METILRIHRKVDFLPPGTELRSIKSETPAPLNLTTSVHGLCFLDDKILMVDDKENKGWNLPGGHIEKGESIEEALRRELQEEAAVSPKIIKPVGYFHIHCNGPKPSDPIYPYPDGYMQVCFCTLLSLNSFKSNHETIARKVFSPAEARELDWVKKYTEMYDLGLEEAMHYI